MSVAQIIDSSTGKIDANFLPAGGGTLAEVLAAGDDGGGLNITNVAAISCGAVVTGQSVVAGNGLAINSGGFTVKKPGVNPGDPLITSMGCDQEGTMVFYNSTVVPPDMLTLEADTGNVTTVGTVETQILVVTGTAAGECLQFESATMASAGAPGAATAKMQVTIAGVNYYLPLTPV
jgi:hypothetical protein